MGRTFDFERITEAWDTRANAEQASMAATRYNWLAEASDGRDLLDVSSGTGYGLTLVNRCSRLLVADLMHGNVQQARERGIDGFFLQADASMIPLRSRSVDVVACLEALYYIPAQQGFFREAARVLRPGGVLLISLPNRLRPDFEPGSGSTNYPDCTDLRRMANMAGLDASVYGAFPWPTADDSTWRTTARRGLVRAGLMPRSMRAKAVVKSLVYRNMEQLAVAIRSAPAQKLVQLAETGSPFTMLYLEAHKRGSKP